MSRQMRFALRPSIAARSAVHSSLLSNGTIRQWISRGRLLPRAWLHNGQFYLQRQDEHDRPLCRIGNVIDLARQAQQRDQRTAS